MGLLPDEIVTGRHYRRYYSVDASGFAKLPDSVCMPSSAGMVRRLVRGALREGASITCRGGGTGLTGGALNGGMILDMGLFDRITILEGAVRAGSGVSLGRLNQALQAEGRFLGPNPSVGPYCTIGGMVANNAGGSRSLKYGCMVDNVEGITMVDGRGDTVRLPDDERYSRMIYDICSAADAGEYPATTKNSSGYRLDAVGSPADSHRVVAASEGTLGVLLSATLRTHPLPADRNLAVLSCANADAAAEACAALAGLDPSALEIVGPGVLDGPDTCGPEDILLFAEFEAPDTIWQDAISGVSGVVTVGAFCGADAAAWWRRRASALSGTLRRYSGMADIVEDAAVPPGRLPDLLALISELGSRSGRRPLYYGHAGDCNIHVRLPLGDDLARWYLERVVQMGGTITAEHGDGIGRTPLVSKQYGRRNCEAFLRLKKLFDPHGVFNPGKILP